MPSLTDPQPKKPRSLRRRLLLGAPALAVGGLAAWGWRAGVCAGWGEAAAATVKPVPGAVTAHRFDMVVDTVAAGTPVNPRVVGSNVQWVDSGDDMLGADFRFEPTMLALAQTLAPKMLRYPGGAQSDGYHWALGMGPQEGRGQNNHVNANTMQVTRFGTGEFLELCEATGAAPLITVNVVTGSAEEAAQWLTATNVTRLVSGVTGALLPRVEYWEIGNEPYLTQDNRPDLDISPEEFALRANLFIRALRGVDPTIRIGLPLTVNQRNGVPVTAYPNNTARVLAQMTEPFDYVSLHNAYLPFGLDAPGNPTRQYWGAMAGARAVAADFAAMRALLESLRPGLAPLPFGVTEFSPLFTLGGGASDNWITSPAGALYAADVMRQFAVTPDLLFANQWSLSGNWLFGAIHSGRYPRPVYEAMRLVGEALRGERLPQPDVRVDRIATASVGLVAAVPNLPLMEVLVTRETGAAGRTLRVLMIQKDPTRRAIGRVLLDFASAPGASSATLTVLSCGNPFDSRDVAGVVTRSDQPLTPERAIEMTLPPCSIALLTVALAPAPT